MTRINLCDPRLLTDQHLISERREIVRIPSALHRSMSSSRRDALIRDWLKPRNLKFRLGEGQVKFWYTKYDWLVDRYDRLGTEMRLREFSCSYLYYPPLTYRDYVSEYQIRDWCPDKSELALSWARLREKVLSKPDWYTYHRLPLTHPQNSGLLKAYNKLYPRTPK